MNRTMRIIAVGAMFAFTAAAVAIDFVLPVEQGFRPPQPAVMVMCACYLAPLIICYLTCRRWQTLLAVLGVVLALGCLFPFYLQLAGDGISGPMVVRRAVGSAMFLIVGGGMLVHKRTAVELLRLKADLESKVETRTHQDREAAAAALRARAEFDALAGIVLDGVVISDNGVVVSVSPQFPEILGYTAADIVGSQTLGFIAEHFRQTAIDEFRRPSGRPYELLLVRGDGSTIRVETCSTSFESEGKQLYVCGFRDLSQKLSEQREIVELTEHERRRVGHELRDNLGQLLVSLSWAAESLAKTSADLQPELEPEALHISALAARCVDDCRQLARQLAPRQIAGLGLGPMLEILRQRVEATPAFRCRLEYARDFQPKDDNFVYHLYAIAEEAISSGLRYGGGSEISIEFGLSGGNYVLMVADNGCSIADRDDDGAGLRSMRYRARLIDGIIDIESPPGGGSIVRCTVPAAVGVRAGAEDNPETDRRLA